MAAGVQDQAAKRTVVPGARKLSEEQQELLRRVEEARRRDHEARAALLAAIRAAHDGGCSLRSIEDVAGMSYQRVHQILRGE